MLIENDSDIIMIDFVIFKEMMKSFKKQNIRKSLLSKKQEIYKNNKCFHSKFETQITNYIEKKHTTYKFRENTLPKKSNRLHIISTNFDDTSKNKKTFMSNLNKLSSKNKENLLPKIKEIVLSVKCDDIGYELYLIVWDFIKKSYDPIYIDVLSIYEKDITEKRWNTYVENKEWFPGDYILENNILSTHEDMYDLFCNYVTWKKQVTNINRCWSQIHFQNDCLNKCDCLLNDLWSFYNEHCQSAKSKKHILDFALEQMLGILKFYKNCQYIDKVKSLDVSNLESSTKFIIMDITELK